MSQHSESSQGNLENELELFAPSRSRGGASKALREHLRNVESELNELRVDMQELEEAILQEPARPLEEALYPRNELGSQRGEIRRGVASHRLASARQRIQAGRGRQEGSSAGDFFSQLRALPWGQILGLVLLVVAVIWLIGVIW